MNKTYTIWLAGCLLATAVQAAGPPPQGPVSFMATASAFGVLPSNLRGGGRMGFSLGDLAAAAMVRASNGWAGGVAVEIDRIGFDFDNPAAFGGVAPWGNVTIVSLAAPVSLPAFGGDLRAAPSIRWAREDGAAAGSSTVVGGILSYTRRTAGNVTMGVGAAFFSGLEDVWGFPFLAVRWQINDALRLSNPPPLGPATPAGLELAWRFAPRWELAGGGSYRSERFRLDDEGAVPGGIGEWKGVPVWTRLSYRVGPAQVSAFAGAVLAGRMNLDDREGERADSERMAPAPMAGLAATIRF